MGKIKPYPDDKKSEGLFGDERIPFVSNIADWLSSQKKSEGLPVSAYYEPSMVLDTPTLPIGKPKTPQVSEKTDDKSISVSKEQVFKPDTDSQKKTSNQFNIPMGKKNTLKTYEEIPKLSEQIKAMLTASKESSRMEQAEQKFASKKLKDDLEGLQNLKTTEHVIDGLANIISGLVGGGVLQIPKLDTSARQAAISADYETARERLKDKSADRQRREQLEIAGKSSDIESALAKRKLEVGQEEGRLNRQVDMARINASLSNAAATEKRNEVANQTKEGKKLLAHSKQNIAEVSSKLSVLGEDADDYPTQLKELSAKLGTNPLLDTAAYNQTIKQFFDTEDYDLARNFIQDITMTGTVNVSIDGKEPQRIPYDQYETFISKGYGNKIKYVGDNP